MKNLTLTLLISTISFFGLSLTGGPDTFGYTFIDSDEANGPLYNWIEIATPEGGSGTHRTGLDCDDCHEANIPLGLTFPFYGTNFTDITIGSNGTIYFEDIYLGLGNSCLPGTPTYTMTQYNFIAHLWDDLDPSSQGGIYTQAFADYFVIEFYDIVPCCGAGDGDSWQIILFSNGNIIMQYKELSNIGSGTDYTVGIQNDPTVGLEYLCNSAAPISSLRSILWLYPGNDCLAASVDLGVGPYCIGDSLVVSNAVVQNSWSDMSTDSVFNMTTGGTYNLITLFTDGCSASDTFTVIASPLVTAVVSNPSPCPGDSIILYGTGTDTYVWDNSVTDSLGFVTTPGTTNYTLIGTDTTSGCTNTTMITVTSMPQLVLSVNSSNLTPCVGDSIILYGIGADTYTWNNGVVDSVGFLALAGSTSYLLTGTDTITGCSDTTSMLVTTFTETPVTYTESDLLYCTYESPVTLTEGTPVGGVFSGLGVTGNTFDPSTGVGSYVVTYAIVDGNGCANSDSLTIEVDDCLSIEESDLNISIYPNPTTGSIQINGYDIKSTIVLTSIDGKVISSEIATSSSHQIDMTELESGIYLIKINNMTYRVVKK